MNWQMKAGVGIFILAVIALIIILILPAKTQAPTTGGATTTTNSAAAHADLIRADSPEPGSTITSPLTVSGQARGTWYFEASFPYELDAQDGTILAQGPAQAQGDWMTTDFVPFLATITFPAQPSGSKGTLLLKKDNPSGDPTHDDKLVIPVTF